MKIRLRKMILSAALICSPYAVSEQKSISVAFSEAMGPYSIAEPLSGIEIEIYRAALGYKGYAFQPVFWPTSRILDLFLHGEVDAVSKSSLIEAENDAIRNRNERNNSNEALIDPYYGADTIWFRDVFLTRDDVVIREPEDLRHLLTVGFYSSDQHYMKWLEPVIEEGNFGKKTLAKDKQLRMLLADRVDLLVGDERIFRGVIDEVASQNPEIMRPLKITRFYAPYPFRPAFRSEKIRDDFNEGLAFIMEEDEQGSSTYTRIINRYDKNQPGSWVPCVTLEQETCDPINQSDRTN